MSDFGIEIEGDRLAALRFEHFPERARAAIAKRLQGITQELLGRVRGAEPSRTGRLRSETQAFVDHRENAVIGRVKVVAPATQKVEHGKGAALEYGAHTKTTVRGHSRQLDHVFNKRVSPRAVFVAAYGRRPNIIERRFLRGSINSMRGEVIAQLRLALAEAAAES